MTKQELERDYIERLNEVVDMIYGVARDTYAWGWEELAHRANLSVSTVNRIGNAITLQPRFRTIHKLAKAVGMEVCVQSLPHKKRKVA